MCILRPMVLKLERAPRRLVKNIDPLGAPLPEGLLQEFWGQGRAFLTSCQVVLMPLTRGPHFGTLFEIRVLPPWHS